jgi:putative NIF3 family GTP cyclohydrolase 1 type 2
MTAQDIVARIQQKLAGDGIAWRTQTVDTFKAGVPDTEVRGIATTGMATFDLLRRAAARNRNLVITHEPTFYGHTDDTTPLQLDEVYLAKEEFIRDERMVVWRFHDHAHMLQPDPLVAGSARVLGWEKYASPVEPRIYELPETTLRVLAMDIQRRLSGRAVRVVGDPDMAVRRVMLGPGYGVPPLLSTFDVSVGGEIAESGGNAAFAIDAAALGQPRAMIVLGHMLSEDFGMQEVADWLRTFVTDVPIEWIPAGEPFS